MKEKNNEHAIKRIVGEIEKIGKKANKIMFYRRICKWKPSIRISIGQDC